MEPWKNPNFLLPEVLILGGKVNPHQNFSGTLGKFPGTQCPKIPKVKWVFLTPPFFRFQKVGKPWKPKNQNGTRVPRFFGNNLFPGTNPSLIPASSEWKGVIRLFLDLGPSWQ